MNHTDDKVLILQNDFNQIKAKALDYANADQLFGSPEDAEEALQPVVDFMGLLTYMMEGDAIIQTISFADILSKCGIIEFKPPFNNKWYDTEDEVLAMELDILFRGLSNGLDDGLTDVLRV
jgi:hypothetical protein